ncbi:penicillin-binding protein 1A [Sphingomonas naasensis]|uniref:Penicillin-binding protein n=1 Tax=Sphingomonas naasensis TaxID=1344951 RepID=A0A4S1WGH5_9SPHN|nr:transglycosylase domain-containing protein [Sphingomonas naasensis]NIJ22130.1 penicillin-binding protein 1A [Sphingomonas naasensis]TGX42204.1 penicillin-binding protein [Sphingomonas naasensis]
MAREPGSGDVRFPLRRPAESGDDSSAPQVRAWRPQSASLTPLEATVAVPVPEAPRPGLVPDPFWRAPPPPPPPPSDGGGGGDEGEAGNLPAIRKRRFRFRWRWVSWGIAGFILLFVLAVAWLALTAPLSKSLQPPAPPSITLLSAEGKPIARRGADIAGPVDVTKLPDHVAQAFTAIEDRRFYSHLGVDPRGIMRAFLHNATSSGGSQGGSTITQQLAKNAFLTSDRTMTRKLREVMIAFWLEAWLTKEEILSRYLSNVYFGDNVYGLRAAAEHYFSTTPEKLTLSQASLLAGLVKAPSRLAPTGNLKGARERQKLVIGAMVASGALTEAEAARVRPAVLRVSKEKELPNGTYFADWVLPEARDRAGGVATEQTVKTTLEMDLQQAAERAVRGAGLRKTQIALVAMRPDGRVVAMVGGKSYRESPFNRATQARRQPGSTFKLFVYLAALRSGMTPDSIVDDSPVTIGDWSPTNSDGRYAGKITLRQAFAKSSNVVAARLTNEIGVGRVIRAARDLGISTPIASEASIALGTSNVSLLELTAAYAAVANGSYPVRPRGLDDAESADDWLAARLGSATRIPGGQLDDMRSLLATVVSAGTGRGAALSIPAFGKTGTTQDARDAWFIGYAGDLVAAVWIGNDDNSPIPGLSGGGIPARVWRDFMVRALGVSVLPPPPVEEQYDNEMSLDDVLNSVGEFVEGSQIDTDVLGPRDRPSPQDEELPPEDEEEAPPPPRGYGARRGEE